MNTSECLTIACAIVPDRTAVVYEGKRFSYEQLQERVNRLANALSGLGVVAGDRIATMQINSNELIEVYFAAAKLDAISVPVNFRAREEELSALLSSATPAVFFVGGRYLDLVRSAVGGLDVPTRLVSLDEKMDGDCLLYQELLESAPPEEMHFPSGEDEDTTVLMFTAGTTGAPKGVMLSHQSFTSYLLANVSPPDPGRGGTQPPDGPPVPHRRVAGSHGWCLRWPVDDRHAPVRARRVDGACTEGKS